MVRALRRAEQIAELGVGRVDVDEIPPNLLQFLARTCLGGKASALARMAEPKKTATLVAVVRHLEAFAVDDTLDLFALLMATRLLGPARARLGGAATGDAAAVGAGLDHRPRGAEVIRRVRNHP